MSWFGQKQKLTQVFLILNFIIDGYKPTFRYDRNRFGGDVLIYICSYLYVIFHVKN